MQYVDLLVDIDFAVAMIFTAQLILFFYLL